MPDNILKEKNQNPEKVAIDDSVAVIDENTKRIILDLKPSRSIPLSVKGKVKKYHLKRTGKGGVEVTK